MKNKTKETEVIVFDYTKGKSIVEDIYSAADYLLVTKKASKEVFVRIVDKMLRDDSERIFTNMVDRLKELLEAQVKRPDPKTKIGFNNNEK
jgi:hypothetical protein